METERFFFDRDPDPQFFVESDKVIVKVTDSVLTEGVFVFC